MTDEQLFARFTKGDQSAYDALHAKYRQELLAFIERRFCSDAEDIVQAAFLKLYTDHEELHPAYPFRPWLFSTAAKFAIAALESKAVELRKLEALTVKRAANPQCLCCDAATRMF